MSISHKKIKVLVADDHHILRHGLISILKEVGSFEIVGQAANGKEALVFLEEYAVDVVLLDIEMPVMNGHETLLNLKAKYPGVKAIIFTTHHRLGYEDHFLASGADAFLDKSSDFKMISQTILEVTKEGFVKKACSRAGSKIPGQHLQLALTGIEREVLVMICQNKSGTEILKTLGLKEGTLKYYRKSIYAKTCTRSLPELAVYAVKQGLISFG